MRGEKRGMRACFSLSFGLGELLLAKGWTFQGLKVNQACPYVQTKSTINTEVSASLAFGGVVAVKRKRKEKRKERSPFGSVLLDLVRLFFPAHALRRQGHLGSGYVQIGS